MDVHEGIALGQKETGSALVERRIFGTLAGPAVSRLPSPLLHHSMEHPNSLVHASQKLQYLREQRKLLRFGK